MRQAVSLQRGPSLANMTEQQMIDRLTRNADAAAARYPELVGQAADYRSQLNDPKNAAQVTSMLENYKSNPHAASAHLNQMNATQIENVSKKGFETKFQNTFEMANPDTARLQNSQERATKPMNLATMTREEMEMRLVNNADRMASVHPFLKGKADGFAQTMFDQSPAAVAQREQMLANFKASPQLAESYLGPNGARNHGSSILGANQFLKNPMAMSDPRNAAVATLQLAGQSGNQFVQTQTSSLFGGQQARGSLFGGPARTSLFGLGGVAPPGIFSGGPPAAGQFGLGNARPSLASVALNTVGNLLFGAAERKAAAMGGLNGGNVSTPGFAPPGVNVQSPLPPIQQMAGVPPSTVPPQTGATTSPVTGRTTPIVTTQLPPLAPAQGQPVPQVATTSPVTGHTAPIVTTTLPPLSPVPSAAQPPAAVAQGPDKNQMWKDLQDKFGLDKDKFADFRKQLDGGAAGIAAASSTPASGASTPQNGTSGATVAAVNPAVVMTP